MLCYGMGAMKMKRRTIKHQQTKSIFFLRSIIWLSFFYPNRSNTRIMIMIGHTDDALPCLALPCFAIRMVRTNTHAHVTSCNFYIISFFISFSLWVRNQFEHIVHYITDDDAMMKTLHWWKMGKKVPSVRMGKLCFNKFQSVLI